MARSFLLLAFLATLTSCGGGVSATFSAGVELEISTEDFDLPEELREEGPSGPRIRDLPCGPMGMCPSSPSVAILCEGGRCDPEAQTVSVPVGDVVDFDDIASSLDEGFGNIDSIEILDVDYQVSSNTLSVATGDVEIFWGPPGSVGIADPGVQRLGRVPPIAAEMTGEGTVVLDAEGAAALTRHFEEVGHSYQFFASTVVDLEPAGAFPEGTLQVAVRLRVRISGSLL